MMLDLKLKAVLYPQMNKWVLLVSIFESCVGKNKKVGFWFNYIFLFFDLLYLVNVCIYVSYICFFFLVTFLCCCILFARDNNVLFSIYFSVLQIKLKYQSNDCYYIVKLKELVMFISKS